MSNISGLTSTAATFECWMKMSTGAGVTGRTQTLVTLTRVERAAARIYAGDDKLR